MLVRVGKRMCTFVPKKKVRVLSCARSLWWELVGTITHKPLCLHMKFCNSEDISLNWQPSSMFFSMVKENWRVLNRIPPLSGRTFMQPFHLQP